mmetsp:Transcript_21844/g.46098  ORF Transcript_21844/g.46098 Transcript_21844/m.46098 type:complete len:220 (+) Transcript_21844:66-725(+)
MNILSLFALPYSTLNLSGQVSGRKDGNTHRFVDDQSQDSHHGGSSVVELDVSLLCLPCVRLLVPSKVEGTVAVVTREFSLSGDVTVDVFGQDKEEKHLSNDVLAVVGGPESGEGGQTVWDVLGTGETDSSSGGEVTNGCEHCHASVLEFLVAKILEGDSGDLVVVGGESHGVEVGALSERGGGTDLGGEGGRRRRLGCRRESGGATDKRKDAGGLHGGG